MSASPLRLLQVFNQYLDAGGEELWVDQMEGLLGEAAEVSELRFFSSDWRKPGAPSRLAQARLLWDNPDSRRQLDEDAERSFGRGVAVSQHRAGRLVRFVR